MKRLPGILLRHARAAAFLLVVPAAGAGTERDTPREGVMNRTYCNPIDVPIADPFVMRYEGVYYLYGTDELEPDRGVPVLVSRDLVHWERRGFALEKSPETWSRCHFWGPEIIPWKGRFLLYFNASPNASPTDLPLNMHLCIAEGDSPLGPFREIRAPFYGGVGSDEAIDQNVFIDDDGQGWLFFTRVTRGRNEIQAVKLSADMTAFDGEPVSVIRSSQPWDSRPWEGHLVAEGAFVMKHKGLYYMMYTGNHFLDPDYAIGYATASHPLGPWTKFSGNPILRRTDRVYGPGNGCVVPSPDGTEQFLVYHTHYDTTRVAPRRIAIDRIRFVETPGGGPDRLVVDGPTHTPQPVPSGAPAGVDRPGDSREKGEE